MFASLRSPEKIFALWRWLSPLPCGRRIFDFWFGLAVPYSGALGARIHALGDGISKVSLKERRAIQNHLNSVHAMALANVCELGSGLALLSRLPSEARGILVGFSIRYIQKARGVITVECDTRDISLPLEGEVLVPVEAKDGRGNVVVTAEARWRLGVKRER